MKRVNTAWRWQALLVAAGVVLGSAAFDAATRKFYPDDPLPRDPEEQDASHVKPKDVGYGYEGWQIIRGAGDRTARRAINVNSMDEVPDSSWFTNRIGSGALSIAEITVGPDRSGGPAPGPWTVLAVKTSGVTPGFQLKDSTGQRYFVKFDPPTNPEMASGAEIISTKILYALGYHVPENYIATLRREDLVIGAGATLKGADGKKQPLTPQDLDRVLQQAARQPDGVYRIMASRPLEGIRVGPFQYEGTRPDDPNDIVPHEHRRELRGLRVFAAWLNHVDARAENSLDTLVRVGPRTIVRHHLLDFGSTLGSGGVAPMERRRGYEYFVDKRAIVLSVVSLGLYVPPWQRAHYPDLPAVGRIDADHFQPERWKPILPNPAFQNARPDDTFWAAVRVMAFSDDAIRAVVRTARLSDPRATDYLSNVLIKRRDQIGRTWLTAVNPVVQPSIGSSGLLTFRNAATDAGLAMPPAEYRVRWAVYDNETGTTTPVGHLERHTEPQCPVPADLSADAKYLMVEIGAIHPAYPSWATPVRAFFRRNHDDTWTTVGLERPPEGEALLGPVHSVAAGQATSMESSTLFQDRVDAYVALHRQYAQQLVLKGVDPDSRSGAIFRQALRDAIRQARRHAQPGDVFYPVVAPQILQLVRADWAARPLIDRQAILATIPRALPPRVNDPYPKGKPFCTMPPGLLRRLHPLPPELQYRFIERTLILLDVDASLIVDVLPEALPRHP